MKDQNLVYLQNVITQIRGRLFAALLLSYLMPALLIAGGLGALLLGFSFLFPIYYASLYAVLIWALGVLAALLAAAWHGPDDKKTALFIDSFQMQERVTTALENREEDTTLARTQRADAAKILEEKRSSIKIKYIKNRWMPFALFGLAALHVLLAAMPAPMKERAADSHEASLIARQQQAKIGKAEAAIEKALSGELTESQKEELGRMKDELAAGKATLSKEMTLRAAEKEAGKLDFKLQEMSKKLRMMASQQSDPQAAQTLSDSAGALADAAGGQEGSDEMAQNGSEAEGEGQNSQGAEEQDGENTEGQSGGEAADGAGEEGEGKNSQGAEEQDGERAEGQSGGGSGGESSENGASEERAGEEAGGGQSDFGSAGQTRDYVSLPNPTGKDENLTGQIGQGDSDSYRDQNGLTWEGEHVDGKAVMGEYRQKAVEGLSRGRYPKGMTDVIKNYFDGF